MCDGGGGGRFICASWQPISPGMPAIGTRREEVAAQPQLTMHSWVESPPRMEGRGREGALAGGIFAEMVGVRPLCGGPSISVATEQPSARCVAYQPVGGGDTKRLWVFFPISKSFIQAFLSSSFRDQNPIGVFRKKSFFLFGTLFRDFKPPVGKSSK